MAENAFIRARINAELKDEASAVLEQLGLTVSDVVRITLTRVAYEKGLPFELRLPNKTTEQTLERSERGEDLHYADDAESMFQDLGI